VDNIISSDIVLFASIYAFVMIGVLIAHSKGRIPAGEPGYFDLGKWLVPVAVAALVYDVVIALMMTIPKVNNIAGEYWLILEAVGMLWFIVALARRVSRGQAGPNREAEKDQVSGESAAFDEDEIALAEGERS
jgi:hypothetical protein